ncbi:MAG: DNA cytosine methyltransferase [Actinomycetota bacterium]|nr:DNA cytosine methyltransferase [Actinomycetota bacterium]
MTESTATSTPVDGPTGATGSRTYPERPERHSVTDDTVRRVVARRDGSSTISMVAPIPADWEDRHDLAGLADAALVRRRTRPDYEAHAEPLLFADLFSGCGALSLGVMEAARALGRTPQSTLSVDLDSAAIAVYRASLAIADARVDDLSALVNGKLEARTTESERSLLQQLDRPEVVVTGPPCQGHSALNNHSRHDDDRNNLYLRAARFAALAEPSLVLIENVASITRDRRRSAELAREHLDRLGYETNEGLVDLHQLGVPQLRRRHLLVAARGLPTLTVEAVVDAYAVDDPASRTVGWTIADLDDAGDSDFDRPSRPSAENQERIDWLHRKRKYDLPNEMRPRCHHDDNHTYKSMYGRLWWDRPAQTITSGYGSMGQGRYVHPRRRRTLTPHEAARLQLIPDFFDFSKVQSRGAWAQMIGNAAPMKLSYAFVLEAFR